MNVEVEIVLYSMLLAYIDVTDHIYLFIVFFCHALIRSSMDRIKIFTTLHEHSTTNQSLKINK